MTLWVYSKEMGFRSTLLRVVLGLGVILNGSPFAMAAPSFGMHDHSQTQTLAQEAEGDHLALPSCHETAASNSSKANGHSPLGKGAALSKSSAPSPDCCKSGRCSCACVHAAATLPSFLWVVVAEIHGSVISPIEAGLPAPILPHLRRPPIA